MTAAEWFATKYQANASGCWLWLRQTDKRGYGKTHSPGRNRKSVSAHRRSWELHRGPIPEGAQVLHRCDVRACVNPDHLFLGSHQDNMSDKAMKGRAPHSESHPMARLSVSDVLDIRCAYATLPVGMGELSAAYRTSISNIHRIIHAQNWQRVAT